MRIERQNGVLQIRLGTKDGEKAAFQRHLYALIETMKDVPAFVNATIRDDPDHTDDLVIYGIRQGARASGIENENSPSYRVPYENLPAWLVDEMVGN
jgi:hypothetical protein